MTVCHSEVPVSKIAFKSSQCACELTSCPVHSLRQFTTKILKLTDKSSKEGEKNCHNNLLLNILEKKFASKTLLFQTRQMKIATKK